MLAALNPHREPWPSRRPTSVRTSVFPSTAISSARTCYGEGRVGGSLGACNLCRGGSGTCGFTRVCGDPVPGGRTVSMSKWRWGRKCSSILTFALLGARSVCLGQWRWVSFPVPVVVLGKWSEGQVEEGLCVLKIFLTDKFLVVVFCLLK